MPVSNIGLGAVLTFNGKQAVAGMGRAGRAAFGMERSLKSAGAGARQMQASVGKLAFGTAGFGIVGGIAAAKGIGFEQSMANVLSVLKPAPDQIGETKSSLGSLAKQLGASTQFTASEAANAMEDLARAGFDVQEIMKAVPGVLDAAAASGFGLADTAGLMATTLRSFQLETGESARVAGVLALTTARTNTTMESMRESLKFAARPAKEFGISVEETAAAIGLLGNVGIKGSQAGTGLRAMFTKLKKPTKEALELFGGRDGFNEIVLDSSGKFNSLSGILQNIIRRTSDAENPLEALSQALGVMGIRGGAALSGLEAGGLDKFNALVKELKEDAAGAAKEMAKIRLDTLKGDITILGSAMEGVFIESFSRFSDGARGVVKSLTNVAQGIATTLQFMSAMETAEGATDALTESFNNLSPEIRNVGESIFEAFEIMKNGARFVKDQVINPIIGLFSGLDSDIQKRIIQFGVIFATVLAALAPVMAALFLFGPAISGTIGMVVGLATMLSALLMPGFLLMAGVAVGAFAAFRNEGESTKDTLVRLWGVISERGRALWQGLGDMISLFVDPIKEKLMGAFERVKGAFSVLFDRMGSQVGDTTTKWETIGQVIGWLAGMIGTAIAKAIEFGAFIIELGVFAVDQFIGLGEAIGDALGWAIFIGLPKLQSAFTTVMRAIAGVVLLPFTLIMKGFRELFVLIQSSEFLQNAAAKFGVDLATGLQGAVDNVDAVLAKTDVFNVTGQGAEGGLTGDLNTATAIAARQADAARLIANGGGASAATEVLVGPPVPKDLHVTVVSQIDGQEVARNTAAFQDDQEARRGDTPTGGRGRAFVKSNAIPERVLP